MLDLILFDLIFANFQYFPLAIDLDTEEFRNVNGVYCYFILTII